MTVPGPHGFVEVLFQKSIFYRDLLFLSRADPGLLTCATSGGRMKSVDNEVLT